jgi:hypothetical protein
LRQLDDSTDTPIDDATVDAQFIGPLLKIGAKVLPKLVKGVAKMVLPKIDSGIVDSPALPTDGPGGSDLAT